MYMLFYFKQDCIVSLKFVEVCGFGMMCVFDGYKLIVLLLLFYLIYMVDGMLQVVFYFVCYNLLLKFVGMGFFWLFVVNGLDVYVLLDWYVLLDQVLIWLY